MNIADPKYLDHLRDLPSGYLLDLLADNDELDSEVLYWVLQERGFERKELEKKVLRRRHSPWARPSKLWRIARWLTIFNLLIVSYFNGTGLYRLFCSEHLFRTTLLFLAVGSILFGFLIGSRLTTHLYQGGKTLLVCGFPLPVGSVDLKTGAEILMDKKLVYLYMAINALVGVNLTLFPLVLIVVTIT